MNITLNQHKLYEENLVFGFYLWFRIGVVVAAAWKRGKKVNNKIVLYIFKYILIIFFKI